MLDEGQQILTGDEFFLQIRQHDKTVVSCKPDGSVIFGEGYTTNDEAAKIFWECLAKQYPNLFLKKEVI